MEVIKVNDQEFKDLIEKNEKVLVKFYAGWCGSCRLIAPKYKQLANDENLEGVVFVEVDAEHNPETRGLAGVNNLPFFAGFKNGELTEGFPSSKMEAVQELASSL